MEAIMSRTERKRPRVIGRSAMLGVALVFIMAVVGPGPSQASDQASPS